ncbi:MAG: hypothetical protein AB2L14_29740 [Candidatus Xenobiia bacterium LiM19]
MVDSWTPITKENPSRDNHITGECQETRQGEKTTLPKHVQKTLERHKFNKVVTKFHEDFLENGDEKGVMYWGTGEKHSWDEDCNKMHTLEQVYEQQRDHVNSKWNYYTFRGGFLAGIEYARSGGAVCQS